MREIARGREKQTDRVIDCYFFLFLFISNSRLDIIIKSRHDQTVF